MPGSRHDSHLSRVGDRRQSDPLEGSAAGLMAVGFAAMPSLALLGDKDLDTSPIASSTRRSRTARPAWRRAGRRRTPGTTRSGPTRSGCSPARRTATTDAVLRAIERALDDGTPLLGTCGGFQYVVLVLAARLAGLVAPRTRSWRRRRRPVVAPLACSLYGEEREVTCVPGTLLAAICGDAPFTGFHFCDYGLAPVYEAALEAGGAVDLRARAGRGRRGDRAARRIRSSSRRSSSRRSARWRAGRCTR